MSSEPEPVTGHIRPTRMRSAPAIAALILATVLVLAAVPATALPGPGETRSA